MNHLIDIGVAGFRIDASKHMWPGDMKAFLDKLKHLNMKWFAEGTRPFIFQEVNCLHIYFILRINIKYITRIGKKARLNIFLGLQLQIKAKVGGSRGT